MIDLKNASREEMMAYAESEHGLKFHHSTGATKMREKLAELEGVSVPEPTTLGPANAGKRITINIQKTSDVGGDRDVFVAVNFRGYQIKRGVDVSVPAPVVEALRNAKEKRYDYIFNERHQRHEIVEREALSYPFMITG